MTVVLDVSCKCRVSRYRLDVNRWITPWPLGLVRMVCCYIEDSRVPVWVWRELVEIPVPDFVTLNMPLSWGSLVWPSLLLGVGAVPASDPATIAGSYAANIKV